MDFDVTGLDIELIGAGRWFTYVDYSGRPVRFKVAGIDSPGYLDTLEKLRGEDKPTGKDENRKTHIRAVATALLKDWELTSDGKPLKYTPAVGYKMLSQERYAPILNWIIERSTDTQQYAEQTKAADAKK